MDYDPVLLGWFRGHNLEKFIPLFRNKGFDDLDLILETVTDDLLRQDFPEIQLPGDKAKIMMAIRRTVGQKSPAQESQQRRQQHHQAATGETSQIPLMSELRRREKEALRERNILRFVYDQNQSWPEPDLFEILDKNANYTDYDGRNILHCSVINKYHTRIKHLLEWNLKYNIDYCARDRWNKIPLHYAMDSNDTKAINVLKKHAQKYFWDQALYAAKHGDILRLRALCDHGVNINARRYFSGRTPLHIAAAEGHLDTVKFLVEQCKMEASVKDSGGNTPFDDAKTYNHREICDYLADRK